MDVALASLNVILGHQLLRRFHFLSGCRPCLTLSHGLNVSLQCVYGCLGAFSLMPLMSECEGKGKPKDGSQKDQSE